MADKKPNAYMDSMILYQKAYDFLKYIYPILAQFPKFEKFALQTQIKTAIFEMMKNIIRFRKTGTKSHIYAADVELEFLRTLIRLSYDLEYKAMGKHRYEVASLDCGRQLEQRRSCRGPLRELQQLPVEREHEHWRVVRV